MSEDWRFIPEEEKSFKSPIARSSEQLNDEEIVQKVLDIIVPELIHHLPENYGDDIEQGRISTKNLQLVLGMFKEAHKLFTNTKVDDQHVAQLILRNLNVSVVEDDNGWRELASESIEDKIESLPIVLPEINWREAISKDYRIGSYEPDEWVNDFRELPLLEVEAIPEPASSENVFVVHFSDRKKYDKNIARLLKLPTEGEISAAIMTTDHAVGSPVGVILDLGSEAITEMHIVDVNSSPRYDDEELDGKRRAANPADRAILAQLNDLGRLTPEQIAVIHPEGWNEIFVESSKINGVAGIIWCEESIDIDAGVIEHAKSLNLPVYSYSIEKPNIKRVV